MNAGREIAGFVVPYSIGILLISGLSLAGRTNLPVYAAISLILTSLLLIFMFNPWRYRVSPALHKALPALIGLSAGAFAGLNSLIMNISSYSTALGLWAEGFGVRLGDFIDAVPFGSDQTNALLKALITGERNDIPASVTEAFRDSGASHILSLSGFHLGIVYSIIRFSFSWLGNNFRAIRLRSVFTVLICGFYTLATGAGPSIMRAFLFILLGELSRILHRKQSTGTMLLSAMMIQLTLSPMSIRSVSFQLSYAAMAGIAWIYPRLRDIWPGNSYNDKLFTRGIRSIWNSAALSIACQFTTGPLAYLYFGTFPKYFLLTNLIALPLTSLLIPVGLAAIVLSGLGICPEFLLRVTDWLVSSLTFSLDVIADI